MLKMDKVSFLPHFFCRRSFLEKEMCEMIEVRLHKVEKELKNCLSPSIVSEPMNLQIDIKDLNAGEPDDEQIRSLRKRKERLSGRFGRGKIDNRDL